MTYPASAGSLTARHGLYLDGGLGVPFLYRNLISPYAPKFFGEKKMANLPTKIFRPLEDMVPDEFAKALAAIPEDYIRQSEYEIIKKAYGSSDEIPPVDAMLRRNFWIAYDNAIDAGKKIMLKTVISGACSYDYLTDLRKNYKRLAYIIKEPAKEAALTNNLLRLGWTRMSEIMKARPGVDNKTGLKDTKLSDLQFKIWQYTHQRIYGPTIQKHQHDIKQQTLQVNVDGSKALSPDATPQDIDEKLKELEHKAANPQIQLTTPQDTPITDIAVTMMEKTDDPMTVEKLKERARAPKQVTPLDVALEDQE